MSESGKAVFLSYASQDAEAARRICEALRAAGVEVWFDQNELVGGDAWDAKIRKQIRDCALFVPVISAATQARLEGYFRLEWKLAAQRTHAMAEVKPFLVPVVIDGTKDADAHVPGEFVAVQWTRLALRAELGGGGTEQVLQAFIAQVQRLLAPGNDSDPAWHGRPARDSGSHGQDARATTSSHGRDAHATGRSPTKTIVAVALVLLAAGAWLWSFRPASPGNQPPASSNPVSPAANPSDKSIAVLPFENLSAAPENAFFADGMHDEVITALGKIQALRVIGRTSVLAYADPKTRQLPAIARTLNVTSILEGTVRTIGTRVKINVQLIDPATLSTLWSFSSPERELTDAFAIQAEIATEVAAQLKATLSPEAKALLARKPTDNVQALGSYIKGRLAKATLSSVAPVVEWEAAIRNFDDATEADPQFLLAFAIKAVLQSQMYTYTRVDPSPRRAELARAAAAAAVRIDPNAPETLFAQAAVAGYVERDRVKALALAEPLLVRLPGDDALVQMIGSWQRSEGRLPESVATMARAHAMNPQDLNTFSNYMVTLVMLRRFDAVVSLTLPTQGVSDRAVEAVRRFRDLARYEVSGDRPALTEARRQTPRQGRDATGTLARYEAEWWSGNWAGARTALADARLAPDLLVDGLDQNTLETVAFHRALTAWLTGDRETARREALLANSIVAARTWADRQQLYADAAILLGTALAGERDDALRRAATLRQAIVRAGEFDRPHLLSEIGRAYALLGEKTEALSILQELCSGVGSTTTTPRVVRLDPCWSQLAGDPRFEQVLNSAKRL